MPANKVLMIRPANFGFNVESGITNSFQKNEQIKNVNEKAVAEFDSFVNLLKQNGIEVIVFNDTALPVKPDAVFPNNWFSTHTDGKLIVYSMLNPNRRVERREDILIFLQIKFKYKLTYDFCNHEEEKEFLEGTGSLVFDYSNKLAWFSVSPRTNIKLAIKVCEVLGYKPIVFHTNYKNAGPVYHTNVVMCMGDNFCVVCLEVIVEKEFVAERLIAGGKTIIEISVDEMEHFAGNMLLLKNSSSEKILVMSETTFNFLPKEKIEKLSQFAKIIHPPIPTIETIGGGSVRCMMAEIFDVELPVS